MTTLTLLPAVLDLSIYDGDSVSFTATLKNADGSAFVTTGYTATANIKNPAGSIVTSFTCTILNNVVTLSLSPTNSATLVDGTLYTYDLELAKTGVKRTFLKGTITVNKDVA